MDIGCKKNAYTKGGKGYRRVVVHTPAARSFSIQQRSPDLALVGIVVLWRLLAVALREPEVEVARCWVGSFRVSLGTKDKRRDSHSRRKKFSMPAEGS